MTNTNFPHKLGKYEILERVGDGGFGIVYHARDPKLDRQVAIKVLRSDLASAPDFVDRFRREARLAASLRHPNIVSIIEVNDDAEGHLYLVMDYLPGGSLAQQMETDKPMQLSRAVEVLGPIAEALDYAHSRNIIHRDVKPANIMFGEDGKPVLTDFGLVKSTLETGTTTTGITLGTAEYMAPEQIQGKEVGPATDLYALGIMAYQMLTGRAPFKGNTPFDVQSKHVHDAPPDPRTLNPVLPGDVVPILIQALAKEPAQRFSSGKAFVSELKNALKRLVEQKTAELYSSARSDMDNLKFKTAVEKLQQALAIQPDQKFTQLIEECERRTAVWKQVQNLQEQKSDASRQLEKLAADENWFPSANPQPKNSLLPKIVSNGISSQQELTVKSKSRIDGFLFSITMLFSLVTIIATMVFLSGSPSESALHQGGDWSYFHYPFEPFLLNISLLGSLALWGLWFLARLNKK